MSEIPLTPIINKLNNRQPWPVVFMKFANVLAERSTCVKYKTAAIVTSGTQIISLGYNGTFDKAEECCSIWFKYWIEHIYNKEVNRNLHHDSELHNLVNNVDADLEQGINGIIIHKKFEQWLLTLEFRLLHREWSEKNEVHAEINALNWISKRDVNSDYCLYTILSPCNNCAKSIISYGIKTVYYQKIYANGEEALHLLKNSGIKCVQIL